MASDFCQKARLAAPITDAQVRLALGFLHETKLKSRILMLFRCAITRSFSLPRAFTGCIETVSSYRPTDRA
ncbi:DUF1198 family protein [Shigella flexneri]